MRLSHFVPAALPFALLLALLTTVVVSPRVHSVTAASHAPPSALGSVTELPAIHVTAPRNGSARHVAVQAIDFSAASGATIRSSWPWMRSELWMPYFSFATPSAANRGL